MKELLCCLLLITSIGSCRKENICRSCDILVNESFSIELSDGFESPVSWGYSQNSQYKSEEICTDEHWDKLMENKDKFDIVCD